jgi:hypothetical protein
LSGTTWSADSTKRAARAGQPLNVIAGVQPCELVFAVQ